MSELLSFRAAALKLLSSFSRNVPVPCLLNDSPCHPKCPVLRRGGSQRIFLTACCTSGATLDEQLDGAAAHPGLKTPVRSRPRPDAAAGGNHPAAARHPRPCAVAAARSRHPDRRAARAKRAADRRRANSLDGCARSCRGRSLGAAGAVGPAGREICRARQCRAAPLRARGTTADRRGQVADARRSAMAAGALDRPLRRDRCPRHRGRDRPRAVARYHGEVRRRAMGDTACTAKRCRPGPCARCCRAR